MDTFGDFSCLESDPLCCTGDGVLEEGLCCKGDDGLGRPRGLKSLFDVAFWASLAESSFGLGETLLRGWGGGVPSLLDDEDVFRNIGDTGRGLPVPSFMTSGTFSSGCTCSNTG